MENQIEDEVRPNRFTTQEIIEAIKVCLNEVSPMIKPRKTLQNMVYFILKEFFINGKRYVVANCPTGSGKTIIGFMVYFCTQYLLLKENGIKPVARPKVPVSRLAYFLTSNKALQKQIDNDIERFSFEHYLYMLKGTNNYPCIPATDRFNQVKKELQDPIVFAAISNRNKQWYDKIMQENPQADFASYKYRPCVGYSGKKLEEKFSECVGECGYRIARGKCSEASCSILNYAYYLNVLRDSESSNNEFIEKYFTPRTLTICDEAHLIPDIICNMFNFEFTNNLVKRLQQFIWKIQQNYGEGFFDNNTEEKFIGFNTINEQLTNIAHFFHKPINRISEIKQYLFGLNTFYKDTFSKLREYSHYKKINQSFVQMFDIEYGTFAEDINNVLDRIGDVVTLIDERPEDAYFESEESRFHDIVSYKHILKDLKEAELVQKNLLSKITYGLFMSATLGDVDEYATLMGMDDNEYTGLMLPSTFDFTNSPIYICKSGWLNYNSFNNNIDKILLDTIKICNNHSKEKGVIHTATFKITNLLKEKINILSGQVDTSRFLFYQTAKEKETAIELMRESTIPYILVGPSLYEGIDLPDDLCRFQILVKVPYAQISGYIKKKMERYPFWYERNCKEKIIQAIGRSNRHANDYSTIYLLDSCFDKIIYDTNDEIVNRLAYKKIY